MDLAPWMIEFAATGGLAKLGSAGTRKFSEKLLGQYAKSKTGQLALRSAGWLGGAAASAVDPARVRKLVTSLSLRAYAVMGQPVLVSIDSHQILERQRHPRLLVGLQLREVHHQVCRQHGLRQQVLVVAVAMVFGRGTGVVVGAPKAVGVEP